MSGIDKTYTNSYKDYKEFKEWSDKQIITFYDGYKVCIGDFVWDYVEEDFKGKEIPIMNTPTWMDIYLIQNCKSEFVLDRMKYTYSKNFDKYKNIDLSAFPPSDYKQKRKIKIKRNSYTKFPIHFKPYMYNDWWLVCNDLRIGYNDKNNKWGISEVYPTNTNTAFIKSLGGVVRHLRKQYLPKGITFSLYGNYVGEEYTIEIK